MATYSSDDIDIAKDARDRYTQRQQQYATDVVQIFEAGTKISSREKARVSPDLPTRTGV